MVVYDDADPDDDQYGENETKRSHQITEDQRKIVSNNFRLNNSVLRCGALPPLHPLAWTRHALCSVPPVVLPALTEALQTPQTPVRQHAVDMVGAGRPLGQGGGAGHVVHVEPGLAPALGQSGQVTVLVISAVIAL